MNNPLVSIIIPVYKVEQHIARCLHSVLNQRYDNIEIVLIDDCSPDRSMVIARKLLENSPGRSVRMLRHEQNRGLSAARNTGIVASTGEYIYFLDSDDEITVDCIAYLMDLALCHDAQMVQGNYKSVPETWCPPNEHKMFPHNEPIRDHQRIKTDILSRVGLQIMAWNRLIRKDFIIANDLFFKEGIIHEDEHWNFYLAKCLSSLVRSNRQTYIYYLNKGGIMNKPDIQIRSREAWKSMLKDWAVDVDPICKHVQIRAIFGYAFEGYKSTAFQDFEFVRCLEPLLKFPFSMRLFQLLERTRVRWSISDSTYGTLIRYVLKGQKLLYKFF